MREAYQSDLRHIVDDLLDMADLVGRALEEATQALLEGDLALAERVIAADPHIDRRQIDLDSKVVELLARQAPVATDLRLLVASLRMSSSLERMGDLCAHVALVARRTHPEPAVPEQHRAQIARMSELGGIALGTPPRVIAERDLALAAQVEKDDAELDDLMLEGLPRDRPRRRVHQRPDRGSDAADPLLRATGRPRRLPRAPRGLPRHRGLAGCLPRRGRRPGVLSLTTGLGPTPIGHHPQTHGAPHGLRGAPRCDRCGGTAPGCTTGQPTGDQPRLLRGRR